MSPSLTLVFSQIQRPTWWHEGNKPAVSAKPSKPETIAKRAEMLAWIKAQKRKVSGSDVAAHFELTTSQLWNLMDPLVESGKVIKHKPRHDRSLLEVAK